MDEYEDASLIEKIYVDIKSCAEFKILTTLGVFAGLFYLAGLGTNITFYLLGISEFIYFISLFVIALICISSLGLILTGITWAFLEWKTKTLNWYKMKRVYLNSEEYKKEKVIK